MSKSKWDKWGIVTNQSLQIYKTRKLQDNIALIFSAGVAIISQVARELKEGVSVFLSASIYNIMKICYLEQIYVYIQSN